MIRLFLRFRRPFLLAACALFAVSITGCAAGGSSLRVRPLAHKETYQPRFAHAYAARGDDGDLDVVLCCGAAETAPAGVRQVLHVRVLWRPMKGAKLNEPAATNATLTWYVFADPDGAGPTMIQYDGAGFATVNRDGDVSRFEIRNATLRPDNRPGALNDPIGVCVLSGTVVARNSKAKVNELLAEISGRVAAAKAPRPTPAHHTESTRVPQE